MKKILLASLIISSSLFAANQDEYWKNVIKTNQTNIQAAQNMILNNDNMIRHNQRDIAAMNDKIKNKADFKYAEDNRSAIINQEKTITEQGKAIENNTQQISNNTTQIEKNTYEIEELKKRKFGNNDAQINALNNKINNLENKMNKGFSLMAAMSSIDFGQAQEGDLLIGAGLGHYENSQGVAVGIAYVPNKATTITAKYSVNTDDIHTSAIGIGITHKLYNFK